MRADGPLICAVISLGVGLGLILGYCHGNTGFSFAYPLSGSMLHMEFTTTGPGVLWGAVLVIVGVVLLIWAFFAAIFCQIGMVSRRDRSIDHLVERYPESSPEDARHGTTTVVTERKHTLL